MGLSPGLGSIMLEVGFVGRQSTSELHMPCPTASAQHRLSADCGEVLKRRGRLGLPTSWSSAMVKRR